MKNRKIVKTMLITMIACLVRGAVAQSESCPGTMGSIQTDFNCSSGMCSGTCTEVDDAGYDVLIACVPAIDPTSGQYACTYCQVSSIPATWITLYQFTGTCGLDDYDECGCENQQLVTAWMVQAVTTNVTEPCAQCGGDNIAANDENERTKVAALGFLFLPFIAFPRLAFSRRNGTNAAI